MVDRQIHQLWTTFSSEFGEWKSTLISSYYKKQLKGMGFVSCHTC